MMAGFALLGYIFTKLGCEGAPFLLGFVLGPLMEENLRRSMVLSFGDPTIFLRRPISLTILLLSLATGTADRAADDSARHAKKAFRSE